MVVATSQTAGGLQSYADRPLGRARPVATQSVACPPAIRGGVCTCTVGRVRVDPQRLAGADGLFEWADGEPSGALRVRVRAYTGYREATPNPVCRRETPAGEITLIDSFGDGFRAQSSSFVAGMHDRPTRTAHDGRQLGVQIRLDPLGAFALFGVPMHELGNRVVELSELLGAV